MEEHNLKKEPALTSDRQNESTQAVPRQSTGAPWWLVIVLVLVLLGLASYIAWINSALPGDRKDFLSFFLGPRTEGTQTVDPDSLIVWEKSFLNTNTLTTDSMAQDWETSPEGTNEIPDPALTQAPSPALNSSLSDAESEPVGAGYYIKAGEFKSRNSALSRVSDLRQGNYPAKIIEPDSSDGVFIVTAGEFTSYSRAREQARTIGFILDIRTSVVKKE
jgi:hypothetical protein